MPNRRAWLYVGLFPNAVIAFYPDSTLFYQEYPLGARRTIQRGATYRYREESRELRLSRYLSGRIDRVTGREDTQLIQWTWEAMESSAFDGHRPCPTASTWCARTTMRSGPGSRS